MRFQSALSVLLAITPALAVPPADFGFPEAPNNTVLSVTFPNGDTSISVQPGDLFGVSIPSAEPIIELRTSEYESLSSYNGSYVVLMVDPDARYPQNPSLRFILHWLQTNVTVAPVSDVGTSQLINTTAARAPYRGPGPPTNSSAHRYIFYAFFQTEDFVIPQAFEGYNSTNRTSFNLTQFLDESNLGQSAAAANYIFASNQTGVPQDFFAQAGGAYPVGNGDMITAGPGPAITPTSTASSTATNSDSSSAPSSTGDSASGTSGGSSTATATESAASASGTNAAERLLAGPGTVFAGLMAVLNIL